jgi:hypothetical protein
MSAFVNNLANIGVKSKYFDPLGYQTVTHPLEKLLLGSPTPGRKYYGEGPLPPPGPPTQDTAANAAMQQNDLLRRRRGVYGNIFAGNAPAPQTATKSLLGN